MSVPVRYHCPRCGAIATIERDASLADKSVTPYPLEGWTYVGADGDVEAADGVRFVCGEGGAFTADGCGEPFYLNYVRFEEGVEIEPEPSAEYVTIGAGVGPAGPRGPRWPGGP